MKLDHRRLLSLLFDLMVVGFVLLFTVLDVYTQPQHRWVNLVIGLPMAAAMAFRRRFSLSVMAVTATLALLQVVLLPATQMSRPYDLALLVAMYSTVKYGEQLWKGLVAAAVMMVGIGIEAFANRRYFWNTLLYFIVFVAAVWLTGYVVRTRRQYTASVEERAATAERERDQLARLAAADERAAIARELHDIVAHSLAVMIVQADGATYALDLDREQTRAALGAIASTGRDALEDMRRLVAILRGTAERGEPAPDGHAGPQAERGHRRVTLDQLEALVDTARAAGLGVRVDIAGTPPEMSPAHELTAYRVVQEALTNALRHAGPGAEARLSIRYRPDVLELSIVDDGIGGRADGHTAGHGLVGMRERVAVLGGECSAGPRETGGWQVTARLPISRAAEPKALANKAQSST